MVINACTVSDVSKLFCTLMCDSLPSATVYTDKLYTCAEVQSLVNKYLRYLLSCRMSYIGSFHLQVFQFVSLKSRSSTVVELAVTQI